MSIKPESWVWKFEPVSPSGTSVGEAEEDWLYIEDSKPTSSSIDGSETELYKEHPSRAQVATKLLEELDEWIKEEPFSDWLEEKIELPIFEELPAPECGQNKPVVYAGAPKIHVQQETTQSLLQEFESVLGDVEACHQIYPPDNPALTPPQSPPPNKIGGLDTQLLVTLQPVLQTPFYPSPRVIQQQQQQTIVETPQTNASSYLDQISGEWNAENVSLVPLRDVASELAAVDEYVRSCAAEIAPSSPCTSSGGSYLSSEDSSSPDDPDWAGESSGSSYTKQRTSRLTKNRHKPYSRPTVEDKKVRKKEQNKNAATRYRQKKKQEIKEIVGAKRRKRN